MKPLRVAITSPSRENMSTSALNDYCASWARACRCWTIVQGLLVLALATQQAQAAVECEAFQWMPERLDYNAAKDRKRISDVQRHHFDAGVESLVRGKTGVSPGGDIDFLVRFRPTIIEVWRHSFGFR